MIAEAFHEFLTDKGFLVENPIFDGNIKRAPFGGKKKPNGWYVGHLDHPAILVAGDWATDQEWRFSLKNGNATPEEKAAITRKFEEVKRRRAEEQQTQHEKAASEARREFEAAKPAPDSHPYLSKKCVKGNGTRLRGDNLLLSVMNAQGEIRSIQTIAPDGHKLFKSGGEVSGNFFTIPGDDSRLAIGEGYSTVATVHEATGWTCIVAFNTGNLEPVTRKIRAKYPNAEIIITGDDDRWTDGNPGRTKATAAAEAIGARVVFPDFRDLSSKPTDFNDLFLLAGPEELKAQLQAEPAGKFETEFVLKSLDANEDGDARLFCEIHNGKFIYDHAAGVWYSWAGHFWREDLTNEVMAAIDQVIDVYGDEATRQALAMTAAEKTGRTEESKAARLLQDKLLKRIRALQGAQRKKNILFLATVGRGLKGDEWDREPYLIGLSNGIIDLRTGEHRPGHPDDYIKTVAPTEWKGIDESCPTWERFLSEVFDDDAELIAYIQRLLGYGLIGEAILHIIIILWGAGRNGKGTLLETLKAILGDYTYKAESELLLEQRQAKSSGSPNSGILALRGKRFVYCSETDEGRRLNTSRVKELVGGDTLNARAVYGRRHVEFKPSHLLFLMTNSKPSAPASDYALWQRINLIPFNMSFVDEPKAKNERIADHDLPKKLKAEASGILAWLVRGCLAFQAEGLNPPAAVRNATDEYRHDEDIIGHFINDSCLQGLNVEVKGGELYAAYKEWAEENGHRAISGTRFGREMKQRFDSYSSNYVYYIGIGLKK